jgi:glycolate oxidase FAD binding subunit
LATIAGTQVGVTIAPTDLAEATTVLEAAAAEKATVAFAGGGTELGFGYPPERVDLLLRTEHLSRVVEYAPADMVVEVEAGMPLAALQKILAVNRQRLALDAPHAELASLGGLVACNTFGPRRARFGSLRDLIVGVSLIRADGSRARGGGKVVKNVAGFDLPKIAVGSLGTLGMIATATFRLHPLPETARLCRVEHCSGKNLRQLASGILEKRLEPAALLAVAVGRGYDFLALFEGFSAGAAEQTERFLMLASDLGLDGSECEDASLLDEADEDVRTHGDLRVRLAVPPAALERLESEALEPLIRAFPAAKASLYPSLGIAFFSTYAVDLEAAIASLGRARTAVEALGGNAVLLDARSAELREAVDVFGTVPPSFSLMKRLKERFDPDRRLNRGRFLGGI